MLSNLKVEISLGLLPGEVGLVLRVVAEVTESRGILVNRRAQVQLLDDVTGSEGEVSADDLAEPVVILTVLDCVVRVNMNGQRIGKSNSVRYLNADSVAKASCYQGFRDETSVVGARTVNFSRVLSRVGTSSMRAPTTVGVHDDLSSSETSISSRTTNVKLARWVNYIDTLVRLSDE